MKSRDQLLIEQAYYQILSEQQRLVEEGKILDFIRGMGNKLKNAFDIVNTKLASNPKLLKTLTIAGPILAAIAAKNFNDLNVSSDTVKDLLDTLNNLDPNISMNELSSALADWDKEHTMQLGRSTNNAAGFSGSELEIGRGNDGEYSFSGSHVDTTDAEGGLETPDAEVQTSTRNLESIVTSDLKNVFTDFTCEVIKSSNLDGSGGSSVVEYSGTLSASSDEEALKIITELIRNGIKQSGVDISTLRMYTPEIAVSEQYILGQDEYLLELSLVNRVSSGINSLKTGAQELVNKIKGAFRKGPNASEQRYKFTVRVEI